MPNWEVDAILAHSRGMTDIDADADPNSMRASRKAREELFQEVAKVPAAERRDRVTGQLLGQLEWWARQGSNL